MALENLNNVHLTAAEKTAVNTALTALETALAGKLRNLSAEDRQRYGSINEQNKLIVGKAMEFRNSLPALSSGDVDWVEFKNDFDSRDFIHTIENRLQKIMTGLNNNKTLHDFDNFQAALIDYGYSQYKAGTKEDGYEDKVAQMGQFFKRATPSVDPQV